MSAWALQQIALVAGDKAALTLIERLGGTELKISGRKGGKLARLVGDEAARKIVEALGPEKIVIPMGLSRGQRGRRAMVAKMLAAGAGLTETALACDVHERTARRVRLKGAPALPLFPDET